VDDEPRFRDLTVAEFGDRLASSDPVPGGGSASAVAASLGASLVAMVSVLSQDRPKYAAHADLHRSTAAAARELGDALLSLADEDAIAYGAFAQALKLPRETDDERERRAGTLRSAARVAAEVPFRCVEACLGVVVAAESLAGRSNVNASSDLNVATLLAEAGARGAGANVLVNLPAADDAAWAGEMTERVGELLATISKVASATREAVASGEPRSPVEPNEG
jgi:formiminotetrahydrofolate cyclodeaminase